MVQLWMIWGYPATRSRKGIVSPPFCGSNQAVLGESAHLRLITGPRTLGGFNPCQTNFIEVGMGKIVEQIETTNPSIYSLPLF